MTMNFGKFTAVLSSSPPLPSLHRDPCIKVSHKLWTTGPGLRAQASFYTGGDFLEPSSPLKPGRLRVSMSDVGKAGLTFARLKNSPWSSRDFVRHYVRTAEWKRDA